MSASSRPRSRRAIAFAATTAVLTPAVIGSSAGVALAATPQNDSYTYTGNPGTVNLTVLANDGARGTTTITAVSTPSAGTATIASNGKSVNYTPPQNFFGTATFTYTATEPAQGQSPAHTYTASVSVRISKPFVVDSVSTTTDANEDATFTLPQPLLSISQNGPPASGAAFYNDGTVTYRPNKNFSGSDSFVYDYETSTQIVQRTFNVTVRPVGNPDSSTTTNLSSVLIDVLANDEGSITPPAGLQVSSPPPATEATAVVESGQIRFTPLPTFTGTSTFSYSAQDAAGQSFSSTVSVQVSQGQVVKTPVTQERAVEVMEGEEVAVGFDAAIPDTMEVLTPPLLGSAAPVDGTTNFLYTAADDTSGEDTFVVRFETATQVVTATITVTVTPRGVDDEASTPERTSVDIPVLENDEGSISAATSQLEVISAPADGEALTSLDDPSIPAGVIRYTPDKKTKAPESDSFFYRAADASGQFYSAQVTVSITEDEAKPTYTENLDESVDAGGEVETDFHRPGNPVVPGTLTITSAPAQGTAVVSANSRITYTAGNHSGPVSYSYRVERQDGFYEGTVRLDVNPVGVADSFRTPVNTSFRAEVLNNDLGSIDRDSGPRVRILDDPDHGTLTYSSFKSEPTYRPHPGFQGLDTFVYEYQDYSGQRFSATATITVGEVRTPAPTVADDLLEVDAGEAGTVNVTSNDTDVDESSVVVTEAPNHGTATVDSLGVVTFTPADGFSGHDHLHYSIKGDDGSTVEAVLEIDVVPNPSADSFTAQAGRPEILPVRSNDEGDPSAMRVEIVDAPGQGTAVVNADGTVTYLGNLDASGEDSFTYRLVQGTPDMEVRSSNVAMAATPTGPGGTLSSDPVTVTLTVSPAVVEDKDVEVDVDSSVDVDFSRDGETIESFTVLTPPTQGTLGTFDPATGKVRYTPTPGSSLDDSFTYQLTTDVAVYTGTVDIDVRPLGVVDTAETTLNNPTAPIDVLHNDKGSIVDFLTDVEIVEQPENGSVTVEDDGPIFLAAGHGPSLPWMKNQPVYTPDPDFEGLDTFVYEATDLDGDTYTATVTVNVVNLAVDDEVTGPAEEDITLDPLANDDPSVDPSTFTVVTEPESGTYELGSDGTITYTPGAGFSGVDELVYEVDGGKATVSFVVTPIALDDRLTTTAGQVGEVEVGDNDLGDLVLFELLDDGAHGDARFVGDPSDPTLLYTPDAGFTGTDRVVYRVTDSAGQTDEATVFVTVNDGPPVPVDPTPPAPPKVPVDPTRPVPPVVYVPIADSPLAYTGAGLGILGAAGALLAAAGAGISRIVRRRQD